MDLRSGEMCVAKSQTLSRLRTRRPIVGLGNAYEKSFVRYCFLISLSLAFVAFTRIGRTRFSYKVVGCL